MGKLNTGTNLHKKSRYNTQTSKFLQEADEKVNLTF